MIPVSLKEYFVPNTFGVLGYVCVVVHFLFGITFTAISGASKDGENGNLPLYGFVLLSIGLPVLFSVVYSLTVRSRVSKIESTQETSNDGNESLNHGSRTMYVFYFYIVQLAARLLTGIVLTALQYTHFYSNGCNYNNSSEICKDGAAIRKRPLGISVSVINSIVAFAVLVEIVYLSRRYLNSKWNCDTQFVTEYFLRKKYVTVIECTNFYKQQILNDRHNDFHIKLVIHTERAPLEFPPMAKRHEIYDVYTKVPSDSIELEEVKDLFDPNADTKGKLPRSILAIGRPGIGKTALAKQIRWDWAKASDQVNPDYHKKIVFLFQLGSLSSLPDKLTLKSFLQRGTALDNDKFARIYEEVIAQPQVAIIIFDGLDELRIGSPPQFLGESNMIPNDPNTEISAANLFVKLVLGDMLNGATVVVTSRPTAAEFFPILKFDRCVEIIGFTPEKIEEYVSEFCNKENIKKLKAKIWEQIHSSSELLNWCYIPVNCFIVCVTLSGCLRDPKNKDKALPTTLTQLYQNALDYLEEYHERRNIEIGPMAETTMMKLEKLAFDGMKNRHHVFIKDSIDEDMKNSSLLNCIPNPSFRYGTPQFCFIHLTIQEFLAARHVQSFTPDEIKTFLSDHLQKHKWHLVIQFLSGLIGKEKQYEDCLLMLPESLQIHEGGINLNYHDVFVMKCLREVDNEQIVQKVCDTTVLKDVVGVNDGIGDRRTSIDWAAVTYVLKYMKNIKKMTLTLHANMGDSVLKWVQSRCFEEVSLYNGDNEAGGMLRALMKSKCKLNHEHAKLSQLLLRCSSPDDQQILCEFLKSGHARHLHEFKLSGPFIIPTLEDGEILNKKKCPELTDLISSASPEDVFAKETVLIDACCKLIVHQLRKLRLCVTLQKANILSLCKAITDERCKLTSLELESEAMDNESVKIVLEALRHQHCKLTSFSLLGGNLTDECIHSIREAMEDEHCRLEKLAVSDQKFTAEGEQLLRNIEEHPRCKSRGFVISW